jgi:hypothetical protein
MKMNHMRHNFIKGFLLYLCVSLLIGVPFALLNGIWPKNITGWIIIAIFGFPTLLLGEFLGEKLFSERISHALDPDKEQKVISARRITYALVVVVVVSTLGFLLWYLLCDYIGIYFTIT